MATTVAVILAAAAAADDPGSGAEVVAVPGKVYTGVERCCLDDTLYVATNGWTGPSGMRLEKDAAGEWKGALAAILRAIQQHTGMELVFLEQSDCINTIETPLFGGKSMPMYCVLKSSGEEVPIARFDTLWDGRHHGVEQEQHGVYLTTSFMEIDSSALLHVRSKANYGIWQVSAPFSSGLWAAIMVTTLVVGLLMPSVLRDGADRRPIAGGGVTGLFARPRVRMEFLYHPTSMIFGADDLEWSSNLSSRLLRLGWLFFILISVSSYTANLASFFTAQTYEVLGPQDMTALQASTACQPGHSNDEAHLARNRKAMGVGALMGGLVTSYMPDDFENRTADEKMACCWSKSPSELITRCAEKVLSGEADLILSDRIGLTSWLLERTAPERCGNFTWSAGITLPVGNPRQIFLSVNRTAGFPLFSNVQVALAWLRQQAPADIIGRIYQLELRLGEGCPARASAPSERIGLESQLGVFVLVGALVGMAVLAAAWESYLARRTETSRSKVSEGGGAGEDHHSSRGGLEDETAMLTDGDMMREIYKSVRFMHRVTQQEQAAVRVQAAHRGHMAREALSTSSHVERGADNLPIKEVWDE